MWLPWEEHSTGDGDKEVTRITAGLVKGKDNLQIESLLPVNGVLFSDGIETDFLKFTGGTIATIGLAQEKARLVMNEKRTGA